MTKYERTVVKDGISGDIVFYSKSNIYTKEASTVTLLVSWENSTTIQPNSVDKEVIRRLKQADTYYHSSLIDRALISIIYEMEAGGLITEEYADKLLPITGVLLKNFYKVSFIHF